MLGALQILGVGEGRVVLREQHRWKLRGRRPLTNTLGEVRKPRASLEARPAFYSEWDEKPWKVWSLQTGVSLLFLKGPDCKFQALWPVGLLVPTQL